jgi:hypothetical protein
LSSLEHGLDDSLPVKSISLRLPREILKQLKVLANKEDIPYESLIKIYLAQKIAEEQKPASRSAFRVCDILPNCSGNEQGSPSGQIGL